MSKRKSCDPQRAEKKSKSEDCQIKTDVKPSGSADENRTIPCVDSESAEHNRLAADKNDATPGWKQWGPYLAERQWGTVREDYSEDGNCWEYFPHDHAAFRAYQWGEDGLFGLSDDHALLCMSLGLWNGKDPILKERLFGLTPPQSNHGEDVKECYYYLDSTPTHSYMKALYKYPQKEFPYKQLVEENIKLGLKDREYELTDTGIFADGYYWDVYAECAKASPSHILCQYTVYNRGPEDTEIHLMPQVWYRNTWSWGKQTDEKPYIQVSGKSGATCVHPKLGEYLFVADKDPQGDHPQMLYTNNDTNSTKLSTVFKDNKIRQQHYTKDALHEYIVKGNKNAVLHAGPCTKVGAYYKLQVPSGGSVTVRCCLVEQNTGTGDNLQHFGRSFDEVLNSRKQECDRFYAKILRVIPASIGSPGKQIARQAYAGLCFTKQFFHYHVAEWSKGRKTSRNKDWKHMLCHDVISMPDKWEFPWFAAWDLAFHMVSFVEIDPEFAKQQLLLLLSDRYMHPNGQLPGCEFNFSDVTPPVHAWACLKVYHTSAILQGHQDLTFLKKAFHKMMLNFNWWVSKKDGQGHHMFDGGFLGMDNVTCIDRSNLPEGCTLEQVDGTSWMAFYSRCMMQIALELARNDCVYEDMAIKFLEHFVLIAEALNDPETGLWDSQDGFYYDRLTDRNGDKHVLKVRSLVGMSSMFAAFVFDLREISTLPHFCHRVDSFMGNKHIVKNGDHILLSVLPSWTEVRRILDFLGNDAEFLSPYGIRSLSKYHQTNPFSLKLDDKIHSVSYSPGESNSNMFGGNSNWRGPIWLCMNYLILETLDTYGVIYANTMSTSIEYPKGSHEVCPLSWIAKDIRKRLLSIFLERESSQYIRRPVHGDADIYATDEHWKNLVLFYEYFHGDTGAGCGASHQTGWTALITSIMNTLAT